MKELTITQIKAMNKIMDYIKKQNIGCDAKYEIIGNSITGMDCFDIEVMRVGEFWTIIYDRHNYCGQFLTPSNAWIYIGKKAEKAFKDAIYG